MNTVNSPLLSPNGNPSKLTPEQWELVRTLEFKEWFGDWEKEYRIEKLQKSKPIEIMGEEYKGKYELNQNSAQKYILDNFRNEYVNTDTGDKIEISRIGAKKVTSHDADNAVHLQSISAISQIIEKSIFITEDLNLKDNGKYNSYKYYVAGINIGGVDYTVRLTIGVKNGVMYYDHGLTEIEKGTLLDSLKRTQKPVAKKKSSDNGFTTTGDAPIPSYADYKDKRLFSILQTNITKTFIAEYIKINKPEIMNTKEEQKMESALEKPLANEYGQKYETFDVIGERMFEGINFFEGNTKIYNDGDVASIFKLLEIKTRENLFAVLLNDNNNPIILHLSNGNLHSTVGYTTPILAAITKLENIKTVTLIHNHPSGNLNPSPQDAALLKCLANDIQIISPNTTLTDGIIINTLSGQYSVFNTNGDFSQKEIPLCTKEIKHTVYEFDQIVFNANYRFDKDFQIKSSDDIAKYISAHRLSEKDKFGYLLLDYNHHIVGNIVPMIDSISAQNKEEVVRDILKNTVLFGGSRVILYGRGLENQKQIMKDIFQSLKERWNEGIIALDIISFPSNRINKQKADTTVSNKKYLSFLDECIVSELSSQYKTPSMEKQIPICPISKVNDTYLNQAQQKDFNNFQPIILEHFIFNDNTIGAAKIQLNKDFSITVKKTSKKSMAIGGQALTTAQEKMLITGQGFNLRINHQGEMKKVLVKMKDGKVRIYDTKNKQKTEKKEQKAIIN